MREESSGTTVSNLGTGNWLVVLIALIAIILATYSVYKVHLQFSYKASSNHAEELEDEIRRNSGELDKLMQRFDGLSVVDPSVVSTQLTEIRENIESIRVQLSAKSDSWLFAEVEYLVRMANRRALFQKDATTALQLLLSADVIAKDSKGLVAHDLRQALANDIAALQAVTLPDIQGVYLELSALISQVKYLRRELPTFQSTLSPSTKASDSVALAGRSEQLIAQVVERLGNLVDFRRHEAKVRPILPPGEIYYLRQNLVLKLQIAQIALLEREGSIYQSSLTEARDWALEFFDEDATREAMTSTLEHLILLEVGGELPDISASLEEVRTIMIDVSEG